MIYSIFQWLPIVDIESSISTNRPFSRRTSIDIPLEGCPDLHNGVIPNQAPSFPSQFCLLEMPLRGGSFKRPSHRYAGRARIHDKSWSVPPPVPRVEFCPCVARSISSMLNSHRSSPRWNMIACRRLEICLDGCASTHSTRVSKNGIIQTQVKFVQKARMEKIIPLRLLMK
jgi:hypothetical protein